MVWGDRKAERVRLQQPLPANLMGVDGQWRLSCFLIDISATGAKLEVDGSLDILKAAEFFLVFSSAGLAFRRCQLVRVDGSAIGVRFVAEKKTAARRVVSR